MTKPKRGRPVQFPGGSYVTTKLDRRDIRRLDRFADDRLANRAEALREILRDGLDRADRASGAVARAPSRSRPQPWARS